MPEAALVFSSGDGGDAKMVKQEDMQSLGFAFFDGTGMDCSQFFEPKEKGQLLAASPGLENTLDAKAVLRELAAEKQNIAFEITAKATVAVTMKNNSVVCSSKDVRIVITSTAGPHCRLYMVQVI